jgi:hypothetical protein
MVLDHKNAAAGDVAEGNDGKFLQKVHQIVAREYPKLCV